MNIEHITFLRKGSQQPEHGYYNTYDNVPGDEFTDLACDPIDIADIECWCTGWHDNFKHTQPSWLEQRNVQKTGQNHH